MNELLKDRLDLNAVENLARHIAKAEPGFDSDSFILTVKNKFLQLELMQRAEHIAEALRRYLPADIDEALNILQASMGSPLDVHGYGETPFFYLPHSCFIKNYGLESYETAMNVQYELTQRFTAEFSLRPFLVQHPERTLQKLHQWADDPNEHVRRLVSEGTRPRLPWAPRLRQFQQDPQPVIQLLEKLKDDEVLYVRRSVANNLNDISKDHPQIAVKLAEAWAHEASPQRMWVIRHGLRSLIKAGDSHALAVLGYEQGAAVQVDNVSLNPSRVHRGSEVRIAFELVSLSDTEQPLLVDFIVHFVKANGSTSGKVYKLKQLRLAAGAKVALTKKVSLKAMTTRTLYPGVHRVDALINGKITVLGHFDLI